MRSADVQLGAEVTRAATEAVVRAADDEDDDEDETVAEARSAAKEGHAAARATHTNQRSR